VSFSRVHEVFIDLASRRARHKTIGERHILGDVCGVQLATMFAPARAPRDERAAVDARPARLGARCLGWKRGPSLMMREGAVKAEVVKLRVTRTGTTHT